VQVAEGMAMLRCPECDKSIKLLTAKSSGFSCAGCGAKLLISGGAFSHVFALVLFVIEAMFLFAFVKEIWVAVVIISLLAVVNYYVSFRLFLRVTTKDGDG